MSIELVMPSNHLILCNPLLLPPSFFTSAGFFPMSQFFASGGQSVGVSASTSALPVNIQDWFPLGLTGLISLQSDWLVWFLPWNLLKNIILSLHLHQGTRILYKTNGTRGGFLWYFPWENKSEAKKKKTATIKNWTSFRCSWHFIQCCRLSPDQGEVGVWWGKRQNRQDSS